MIGNKRISVALISAMLFSIVMPLSAFAASANADLSGLAISGGALSPAFASGTTLYASNATYGTNSVTVTPTLSDPSASVTVNGAAAASGAPSNPVALSVGANAITVDVTAGDGATHKVYTINVARAAASANADLSGLSLSSGALSPSFGQATTSYAASVTNGTASVALTPTLSDSNASAKVNGTAVASGAASAPVALNPGGNVIAVAVTAQDGTTVKTYYITVIREISSNADLGGLSISAGTLSPAFSSGAFAYNAGVSAGTENVSVTPTAADSGATLKVNGNAVANGASVVLPLTAGTNAIRIDVTAQDGVTTRAYTLNVSKAGISANAYLGGLTLSGGTLSPSFSSATTSYTVSVPAATSSLKVWPLAADASATIKVNGLSVASGASSEPIGLNVGNTPIAVVVTAQSGATNSYVVNVTRPASNNADLSALAVSSGTLSPSFSSGSASYAANITNGASEVTLTPTSADSGATIKVNGTVVASGAASLPVAIAPGANTVAVSVTAQDGVTTKNYTVVFNRANGTNASLKSLTIPQGSLSPAFNSDTLSYSSNVGHDITAFTVAPALSDSAASVKVNGEAVANGGASAPIRLVNGAATATVAVTAQDGITTRTYVVAVTPDAGIPAAPQALRILDSTTHSIQVAWDANTEADLAGYIPYLNGARVGTGYVLGTTFTAENLNANTAYTLKVTAADKAGNESPAAVVIGATKEAVVEAKLMEATPIYDAPLGHPIGASLSPQTVRVYEKSGSWLKIDTWLGYKWIDAYHASAPADRQIVLDKNEYLYSSPNFSASTYAALTPQTVKAKEEWNGWYKVDTWLGEQWIKPSGSADIALTKTTRLYAAPYESEMTGAALLPQTVTSQLWLGDGWYRISTWLGDRWIKVQ